MHLGLGAGVSVPRRFFRSRNGTRRSDRGSVLTITLLMITVCSLIVGGLLTFTATVIRARPPLEERTRGAESARSAMRLAIMMQVSKGPSGCVSQADYPAGTFDINDFGGTITCTQLEYFDTGKNRYGIITTSADPNKAGLLGFNGTPTGSAYLKDIQGDVFLNGGRLASRNTDLLVAGTGTEQLSIDYSSSTAPPSGVTPTGTPAVARYQFPSSVFVDCVAAATGADTFPNGVVSQVNPGFTYSHIHTPCASPSPAPWWSRAGDDSNTRDTNAVWNYPRLPNVPIYDRDGKYVDLTPTCRMYYPGRYDNSLTLDATGGRRHYFASGIYQFKSTVTIASGAKVVFGAGKFPGCAVDSDLALNPSALANHGITGRGATLVLDGAGKLAITNASVQINRRVSTAATRGSEGVAIRTVNLGKATATLQVPIDMVQESEYACSRDEFGACKTPFVPDVADPAGSVSVVTHQRPLATVGATTYLKYAGSTLAATDDAVSVDFTGTTSQSGARFEVDGYIFTPNAKFTLRTPNSGAHMRAYRFVAGSGIVATQVELDAAQLPTTPSVNWRVGSEAQPTQLRVALIARMTNASGRQVTSRAIVEVRSNSSYAVNQWTVDPDQAIIVDPLTTTPTTTAPPTGPTAATTTTTVAPAPTLPVTGAAMWLDASNAASVVRSSSVTAWNDLSGNNRHLTLGTPGDTSISYSTNALNNRPAVVTTGTGLLKSANIDFGSSATVFVVGRMRSTPNGRVLSSPGNNWLLGWWGGLEDQAYYEGWISQGWSAPNPTLVTTNPRLYTSVTNGTTGSLYRNGTLLASAAGWATPRGISVGGWNTTEYSNAAVSEVIVYNRALSPTERATVEQYLATKWWDAASNPVPTTTTTTPATTIPATTTTVPTGASCPSITGWKGEYFLGTQLAGPVQLCRNDADINFFWGDGPPGGSLPSDQFSVRWTRTAAFQAGTYRFSTFTDDGYRLFVDGVLVQSMWNDHGQTSAAIDVTLTAGNHTVVMEYYENGGGATATLSWAPVARYVRVQLSGTNYLSLAEVEVRGTNSQGYIGERAAGATATQSSTDYDGVASRAVDGNTSGYYYDYSTTHSGWESQPWWQVDLGATYGIAWAKLFNRTDCCMERLAPYTVFLSNTDMTGRTYAQLLADPSVMKTSITSYPAPSTVVAF